MPVKNYKFQSVRPLCKHFNIHEAAELLSVSEHTLRSWIYRREIEFTRVGRSIRFREDVLQTLMNEGRVSPLTAN